MVDFLSPVISKMMESGFFDVIVFILVTAILYAFFKKSNLAGGSPLITGVIAVSIGFMVLAYRFVTGTSLVAPLSVLFTQWVTVLLFLIFGFLAASLFYPDMLKWLTEVFHSRSTLSIMIVLGLTLLITSGMINTLLSGFNAPSTPGTPVIPQDIIIFAAGIMIFIVIILIASSIGTGGLK